MSREFQIDEQKRQKPTTGIGNSVPSRQSTDTQSSSLLPPGLTKLEESVAQYSAQTASLNLEEISMLEAELMHQGILPSAPDGNVISYLTTHDVNLFSWYALRNGFRRDQLTFVVDLPRFIIARAKEVLDPACALNTTTALANRELEYLDRVADFLAQSNPSRGSRYQRGMAVVLRALLSPKRKTGIEIGTSPKLNIVLPMSRAEFLRKLSAIRNTAGEV